MKTRNIRFQQSKLIKLQLVKFKFYKQNIIENIEFIELHLKKALQIIYKYHYCKKRIYFIGLPQSIQNQYLNRLQNTLHLFIPETTWINGIISNRASILKYLHQNDTLKVLLNIHQKPDLIVLFNKELETEAFQEAVNLKIPIIAITSSFTSDSKVLYPIYGNSQVIKKKKNNIYIHLLNSIIKKKKNNDFKIKKPTL